MSNRLLLKIIFILSVSLPILYLTQLVAGPFPLPNPFYSFGVPPIMGLQTDINSKIDTAIRSALEREPASNKLAMLEESGFRCYQANPQYMRCDYNQPFMFPFVTRHLVVVLNNNVDLSVDSIRVSGSGP